MTKIRELMKKINIRENEPMHLHTTFKTGGPARLFAEPSGPGELTQLLDAAALDGYPVFILGGGANLLVADKGINALVITTHRMQKIEIIKTENPDSSLLYAQAGTAVSEAAVMASNSGLAGMEFLHKLPGSVGGAVYMNARCYGLSLADVLEEVSFFSPGSKNIEKRTRNDKNFFAEFDYKKSPFQNGCSCAGAVILEAAFRLTPGNPEELWKKMRDIEKDRSEKGHFIAPCAGSVFKNNRAFGEPTGRILDELGMRGLTLGGAQVSPLHANIIINTGGARSADIRRLIETIQKRAVDERHIQLEPEIIFVGDW